MLIMIHYRSNQEFYPDQDFQPFYADYLVDLDKLKAFVASADDYSYAKEEAEMIIMLAETKSKYNDMEKHDKYTFYDTEWERQEVLADDQNASLDYEVYVYLNY